MFCKNLQSFVFLSWGGVFFGLRGRLNGEAEDPLDGLACNWMDMVSLVKNFLSIEMLHKV